MRVSEETHDQRAYRILGDLYEDMKEKYERLQRLSGNSADLRIALEIQKEKNRELQKKYDDTKKVRSENNKLKDRVKWLEDKLDEKVAVITLPKSSSDGHYVTLKKYNKQKNTVADYATKYGNSQRENERLKEQLIELQKQ